MFWATFSYNLRTSLIILDSDPTFIRQGVTLRVIVEVYKVYLLIIPLLSDIFIYNGASIYILYIVRVILV